MWDVRMAVILSVLGIVIAAVGLAAVGFGIPINEFTLGTTLLVVEQNAQVALEMADHAYVMENGRVVLDGPPQRLREHQDIREFYLGTGDSQRRSYRDVKQYRRSRRWYG